MKKKKKEICPTTQRKENKLKMLKNQNIANKLLATFDNVQQKHSRYLMTNERIYLDV